MLSLDTLCIHPGKAAWVLYVDATCINYDGNVFDAALLAMVAALKNSTYHLQVCISTKSLIPLQPAYHTQHSARRRGVRRVPVRAGHPCLSVGCRSPCRSGSSTRASLCLLALFPLASR